MTKDMLLLRKSECEAWLKSHDYKDCRFVEVLSIYKVILNKIQCQG